MGNYPMNLLRSLTRRKLRTALTVIGIAVGIWALVVMAALATKLSAIVESSSTYFRDKVVVTDATGTPFSTVGALTPLTIDIVQQIEKSAGRCRRGTPSNAAHEPGRPGQRFSTASLHLGIHGRGGPGL